MKQPLKNCGHPKIQSRPGRVSLMLARDLALSHYHFRILSLLVQAATAPTGNDF